MATEADVDELAETGREHRAGNPQNAAPNVAESVAAAENFSNDEERPPFAEDVERYLKDEPWGASRA